MKRIMILITLTMLPLLCPRLTHGQIAAEAWVQHYNGPGNGADHATATAVDTNGNVFVTGFSTGIGSANDYATIKYSGTGVALWTNRYNGPGNGADNALAIALDTNGNVFVTGGSTVNGIDTDYATIKYSNTGVPLWTNLYNGPGNGADNALAIALGTDGNVLVTGNSLGSRSHGIDGSTDYATIKYSGAGVPLWTNRYDGPQNGVDQPSGVAVDVGGNVLVTGSSPASSFFPDYTTIKYSGAGVPLWTNRYNGPGNAIDQARAVAVDTNGNVLVTGGSQSDGVTIKYSGAGVPLWTNSFNGFATAIAVDGSGNVFVAGKSSGNGTLNDFTTIKYSGAGLALWTNRYDGPGNQTDEATGMALDTNGNVFVTGYSMNSTNFYDYATVAYSGAGVALWTNRSYGPVDNPVYSSAIVAVDRTGNVFVTGYSPGIGNGYDYVIVKYATLHPSLRIVLATKNTMSLTWPSPSKGFTLQQNSSGIATLNWSDLIIPPIDNGTTKTVIVNASGSNTFYRLSSP